MVRNENDDWTVASTVSGTAATTVTNGTGMGTDVLTLTTTPHYDWIGRKSSMKDSKVCVTIKACDLPDDDDDIRSAVDIVVALDISGSMSGNKIRDCKSTLELMLKNLSSKDRFGLICYGSVARVQFPVKFMTPDNKEQALAQVRAVSLDGMTNLSGGLFLAAQEMKQIDEPNPVQSIFLLTDGHANEGICDTNGLIAMVRESFKSTNGDISRLDEDDEDESTSLASSKPKAVTFAKNKKKIIDDVDDSEPSLISLFCFGYGSDHNSTMLQELATATAGGSYYFVEKDSDVASAFGDAMGGVLSVVAQSCVVTVSVPPGGKDMGINILKVHHDQAIQRENGTYTVNVGDFYAEESRDILLDVSLATSSFPDNNNKKDDDNEKKEHDEPIPHVQVKLSYMDTIHHKPVALGPVLCSIGRPAKTAKTAEVNAHVELQWLRVQTVQQMKQANLDALNNNISSAQQRMNDSFGMIQQSSAYKNAKSSPVVASLVSDVQSCLSGFSSQSYYNQVGQHTVKSKGYNLSRQRCAESSAYASNANAYSNRRKAKMSSAFSSETTAQTSNLSAPPAFGSFGPSPPPAFGNGGSSGRGWNVFQQAPQAPYAYPPPPGPAMSAPPVPVPAKAGDNNKPRGMKKFWGGGRSNSARQLPKEPAPAAAVTTPDGSVSEGSHRSVRLPSFLRRQGSSSSSSRRSHSSRELGSPPPSQH